MKECDPLSLERGVRQLLADKVSGHLVGVSLFVAEHLRLGTWDLLRAWTGQPTERAEPRLTMQLVHEAALSTTGIRSDRTSTISTAFAQMISRTWSEWTQQLKSATGCPCSSLRNI